MPKRKRSTTQQPNPEPARDQVRDQILRCVLKAIAAAPDQWLPLIATTPAWLLLHDPDDSRIVGNHEFLGDLTLAAIVSDLQDDLYPDFALPYRGRVLKVLMENATLLALLHELKLVKPPADWLGYEKLYKPQANAFEVFVQVLAESDGDTAEIWIWSIFTPLIHAAMNCVASLENEEEEPEPEPQPKRRKIEVRPPPQAESVVPPKPKPSASFPPAVTPQSVPLEHDKLERSRGPPPSAANLAPVFVAPPTLVINASPGPLPSQPAKHIRSPTLPLRERSNVNVGPLFNPTSAASAHVSDFGGKGIGKMGTRARGAENEPLEGMAEYASYRNPYPNPLRVSQEERERRKWEWEEERSRIRQRHMYAPPAAHPPTLVINASPGPLPSQPAKDACSPILPLRERSNVNVGPSFNPTSAASTHESDFGGKGIGKMGTRARGAEKELLERMAAYASYKNPYPNPPHVSKEERERRSRQREEHCNRIRHRPCRRGPEERKERGLGLGLGRDADGGGTSCDAPV